MLPPMHCFSSLQALNNNVVLYQVYHSLISRKNKTFQQLKAKSRFFDVFVFCLIFQQTDITLMILNEDITRVRKKITFKMIQILLYFPSPELSFLVFLYKPLFLLKIRWRGERRGGKEGGKYYPPHVLKVITLRICYVHIPEKNM